MTHPSDDHGLFQEIEEDLNRQKIEALWKHFGPTILAGALAIVLVTAGITGWKSFRTDRAQKRTAAYADLLQADYAKPEEGIAAMDSFIAANDGSVQALFARLQIAATMARGGKTEEAAKAYDSIATDSSTPEIFRGLASLLAVQTMLDSGEPAKLEEKLHPLMKTENPWRFMASEYAGHLALRAGDKAKAKAIFEKLNAMPDVPPAIGERTSDMLNWLKEGA